MQTLLVFCTLVLGLQLGLASYVLEDDYSPAQFLNMFDFFTVRPIKRKKT